MMKKVSKLFSMVLSLLLVVGVFQIPAKAAAPAVNPVAQFYGIGDVGKAMLTFNYSTMKIEAVNGDGSTVHNYFESEYFGVSVYDANRRLVINASQIGNATANSFVSSLNGLAFGINYVIQIRHQEPSNRLVLNSGFSPASQTTKSEYYQVTDSGMVKINVNNYGPGIVAGDRNTYVGDSFNPLSGVKAYDIVDGDISGSVQVVSNAVNTTTPGQYRVDYRVTDSNAKTTTASSNVTVLPLPTLSVVGGSVYVGDTLQLNLDYSPENATISYRALNPDIAIINGPGMVKGISKGTAEIEVKLTTADGLKVITQKATVIVKELPVVHVGNVEFYVGDYQYASIIYTPNDATVTYSSANPAVATITSESRITGVSAGITQMSATATTADGQKSASTQFEVAVLALPEVSIPDQTIYIDETIPLNYQSSPDTAKAEYSTDNESVLTIDANGKMTPHALGQATVTVVLTTIDGKKTASASATVTVSPLPTVSVSDQSLYAGETLQVFPEYTPADVKVSYATGDTSIATVDGNGNVTAKKAGNTTLEVIVETADGRKNVSQTIQVTVLALPAVELEDMTIYDGDIVKAIASYSPADAEIVFTSDNHNVLVISSSGRMTAKDPGTTTITARVTTADGKYYAEATARVTVLELPSVLADNVNVYMDDTKQVDVWATPPGVTITYSIEDSGVAIVDANGIVTGIRAGATNLTVTATTADGLKKDSDTVVVTVLGSPTVSATDKKVYTGDSVAIDAQTTPVGNTLQYSSEDSNVATVDSSGNVTGVSAGTTTILITATTIDGLRTAETAVTVTVLALPTIQVNDKYLYAGDSVNAEVIATPTDDTLSYQTTNQQVATVDNEGNIVGVSAGITDLQVTAVTADGQKTVTKTVRVTILALPEIIANDFNIYQSRTEPLAYLATPLSSEKTFVSADESIATVDANGNVTGVTVGTTTITITATTADGQKTASKTVNVTVLALPQIEASDQVIYVGDARAPEFTASPADAVITYEIADQHIAVIDYVDQLNGVNPGGTRLTIRAMTADGKEVAEKTVNVTVLALPTVNAWVDPIYVGDNEMVMTQVTPSDASVYFNIDDVDIATVNPDGLITGLAPGTTWLRVKVVTADDEKRTETVIPVTILPAPELTVNTMRLYTGDSQSATIQFAPDTASLSYTIADPNIAEVQANGVVVAKSAGTTTLTVTLTTADGRKILTESNNVVVVALPELIVSDTTVYLDDAMLMAVMVAPEDATLTYRSADESVAIVDDAGLISPKKAGTTEVTVTLTTADGEKSIIDTAVLTVLPLPTVSIADTEIYTGDTATLNPEFAPANAVVTYTSSDAAIAAVNERGEVSGVSAGTAVIMATVTTADGRKMVSAGSTVTVKPLPDIQTNDQQLYVGDTVAIAVTAGQSGFTYEYSSSDTAVATVDSGGNIIGVNAGEATITIVATTADGKKTTTTTMVATVLALPTVQAENVSIYAGDYQAAIAVFTPIDGQLQWQIEDETIATIDANGRVHGVMAGSTNLTATVTTADGQKTASHTVVITVLALPTLDISARTLYVGDMQGTAVQYTPNDATISFAIADTSIATLDAENNITGVAPGKTDLTVTVVTADGKKSITKTTTITVYSLPTVSAGSKTIYAGDGANIELQYTPASAIVEYKSNNESIVTVDIDGNITGIAAGETTVNVIVTTVDGQKNATIDIPVTVLALPELTLEPIAVYAGDNAIANPVFAPDNAVLTYQTANTTIADVDADGNITGITSGTTDLIVTLATADHQKTLLVKTKITVLAPPTIIAENQLLYFGDTKAIGAEYTPSDATVSYSIEDTSVASIDAAGTITARRVGITTLTITITTADNIKTIEKTVQLQVLALPEMLFPVSAPVMYAGDSIHFAVDYIPVDAEISYQIDDKAIATIDTAGNIQGIAPGTTTLTVTVATVDGQKTATKTATITVLALPTITANPVSVYVDNTIAAQVTYTPEDASLTYRVDDIQIAEMSDVGVVSGLAPGATEYSATATTADGKKTTSAENTISVLALPKVTVIDETLYIDDTKTIVPEFSPVDANVSYQVEDTQVATINADGIITPVAAGTTTYRTTVTTSDGIKSVIGEAKMTVLPLPTVAITNKDELGTIYLDDAIQMLVQTTPEANTLSYNAADTNILSVTDAGVVHALATGTTTITVTATTEDGLKTAETQITVIVLALPILNIEALTSYVGDETPLVMTYGPNDAGITYQSNDETIATVDDFGSVKAIAAGTTEITVTLLTVDGKKTIEQTVPVTILALPTINFTDQSIYIDDVAAVDFAKTPTDASARYIVADPMILTIDDNGQIHPQQVGKTSVQIIVTTADNKKTVEAEAIIEVLPLPEVQASDYVLYSGDSIPFVTTYKPSDATLTYSVADEAIATIATNGTITGNSAGVTQATVSVTTADGMRTASKTVKVTVYPLPTINITNQITYVGKEKPIQMSYLPTDATISYEIANPAIADVTPEGILVGVAAGKTQLTVTLKTADGIKETSKTVDVDVLPLPDVKAADVAMYVGDIQALQVDYLPKDATLSYQVADSTIAIVDPVGNVIGEKAGTTELTIMVTTSDGEQVSETTITVTVLPLPSVNAESLDVAVGESKNLAPDYLPEDATIEYLSADSNIAYVYNDESSHNSGDVFGVNAGTTMVTITVRTADGQKYAETNAAITVTGEGSATAPNSSADLDGKTIIFGLPVTGQNDIIIMVGVMLITSGASITFLLIKRRKRE